MPELDFDELERKSMPPMFSIGYDEMIPIPEGVLPADCITEAGAIDINKAFKFFIKRVRELERQKRVLVEKMAIDILCSECPVSEACPYENATFIDLEDCAKQLEKWSENAAKEAGE